MIVWVQFEGHGLQFEGPVSIHDIRSTLLSDYTHVYFTFNGKKLPENAVIEEGIVRVSSRLLGGKGGFGSMLRAIGAQIEKTTNREACRDLSGRRLRDINEEKRLKNWIAQQAEREREAAERRKKKLERLCFQPKHDFSDQDYEKARTELTEKVHDAVEQGFRSATASTSTSELKRKLEPQETRQTKKKKTCLWVDDIDEDDLSSSDSDRETGVVEKKKVDSSKNSCSQIKEDISSDNKVNGNEIDKNDCDVSPSVSSEDAYIKDDLQQSPLHKRNASSGSNTSEEEKCDIASIVSS